MANRKTANLRRLRNRRLRLLLDNYPGPALSAHSPYSGQTQRVYAGLRSSATTEDGISALGSIQLSAPPDFDATNGASGTASSRGVLIDSSGFSTALNASGSVRFEVPTLDLDSYPASTSYYFGKSGGQLEKLTSGSGYQRERFPEDSAENRIFTDASTRTGVLTSTFSEIAVSWDASNVYFSLDHLPYDRSRSTLDPDSAFESISMVGLPTGAGLGNEITMRNFGIYTGAPDFTANSDYGKIVFFGDSFIVQGSLHSSQVGSYSPWWNPGYGFQNGGAASTSGSYTSDTNLISAFMRECFRGGLIPGSSNHNDAESGDRVEAMKDRAVTWFSSNTAQVAVVGVGANDIGKGSAFDDAYKAGLLADYKTFIDTCVSNGCNRIVINTSPSLRNDPSYQNATHDGNITWYNNTLIPQLAQYNSAVVVADCFTTFGGINPTTDFFQSNNIHPAQKGQHMFGKTLGEALMASF